MLNYAILCFAAAAVGGMVLAASVLRGRLAPWALSLVHAVMGALGLVLTFATVFQGAAFPVRVGFVVLIVAALGGFYLASFHLRGRVGPSRLSSFTRSRLSRASQSSPASAWDWCENGHATVWTPHSPSKSLISLS